MRSVVTAYNNSLLPILVVIAYCHHPLPLPIVSARAFASDGQLACHLTMAQGGVNKSPNFSSGPEEKVGQLADAPLRHW